MTSKFRRISILRLTIQAGDVIVCLERVAILNCSMERMPGGLVLFRRR